MAQPRTRSWEKVVRMHLGLARLWLEKRKKKSEDLAFYGLEKRRMKCGKTLCQ